MNKIIITGLLLFWPSLFWPADLRGLEAKTSASQSEAKISESRKNGKYKKLTEIFINGALSRRTEEVSLKDDGTFNYVFVKVFRKGALVFASTTYVKERRTIRSYYQNGRVVIEEGDEDGDGVFETMILFDSRERPAEAFTKSKDGLVSPFSEAELDKLIQSFKKYEQNEAQ